MKCDGKVFLKICTHFAVYYTVDGIPEDLTHGDDDGGEEQDEGCDLTVQSEHHIVRPKFGELEIML